MVLQTDDRHASCISIEVLVQEEMRWFDQAMWHISQAVRAWLKTLPRLHQTSGHGKMRPHGEKRFYHAKRHKPRWPEARADRCLALGQEATAMGGA